MSSTVCTEAIPDLTLNKAYFAAKEVAGEKWPGKFETVLVGSERIEARITKKGKRTFVVKLWVEDSKLFWENSGGLDAERYLRKCLAEATAQRLGAKFAVNVTKGKERKCDFPDRYEDAEAFISAKAKRKGASTVEQLMRRRTQLGLLQKKYSFMEADEPLRLPKTGKD